MMKGTGANPEHGMHYGHRRLSIQDLSTSGHQPMESSSGRYIIAYNGEIYNFRKIQKELVSFGHQFHDHSDTEVLLAAVEQGIANALTWFTGMFALALWDKKSSFKLARDRIGENPLLWVAG